MTTGLFNTLNIEMCGKKYMGTHPVTNLYFVTFLPVFGVSRDLKLEATFDTLCNLVNTVLLCIN